MRVALCCYPMVFQRPGGLANKVRSTLAALERIGLGARLFDWTRDRMTDFDLVHVFGTGSGNHRIVEAANDAGVPVVLSSVFSLPYSQLEARRDRVIHEACVRLSRHSMNTSWGQTQRALRGSARIVTLGDAETRAIVDGFGVDARLVRTIPNGISDAFFEADAAAFLADWQGNRPIVLMSGAISPEKNQLNAVRALESLQTDLILFGPMALSQEGYLDQCLREGRGKTHYLGTRGLTDPFYVSAFAAAAVTLLPSRAEVTPNVVLESLAAGTPAVCTIHNAWDREFPAACFRTVDPEDVVQIQREVSDLLRSPPSKDECRSAVRQMRWSAVAEQLLKIYRETLAEVRPSESASRRVLDERCI